MFKEIFVLKEYQEVIAVGSTVRDIKVGDKVMINPIRYAKKKHQEGSLKDGIVTDNPIVKYEFNVIKVNGENCLLLYDQDIMYIFEGEEIENKKNNKTNIILPDNEIICYYFLFYIYIFQAHSLIYIGL